jgi:hypothetical protein
MARTERLCTKRLPAALNFRLVKSGGAMGNPKKLRIVTSA